MRILFPLLLCLSLPSCYAGDIASSSDDTSHDQSIDNSVDNSISGISSCEVGTSFNCVETGIDSFEVTEECMTADGSPVVVNGPDVSSFCPVLDNDEPIEFEDEEPTDQVVDGGGIDQQT